jgi:sugar lactone lactonase YvrE
VNVSRLGSVAGLAGGLLLAASAPADQLAWISASDASAAAARVAPDSLLVAYCSDCNDRVEVWRVRKAEVAPTTEKTYFQLRVTARRLFRSRSVIARGEYREPIAYEPAVAKRPDGSDLDSTKDVDLAYVYVPQGGGRFRVLGKAMGLPCDVMLETITLPDTVMKALGTPAPASSPAKDPLDAAIDVLRFESIAAHEVGVLGDIRSVLSAEAARHAESGAYGEPKSLRDLDPAVTSLATRHGYRRSFHPRAPSRIQAFAYTAVPEKPGETGIHAFCGDETGRICYTPDGPWVVVAGHCSPSCRDLPDGGITSLLDAARPRLSDAEKTALLAALDEEPRMGLQTAATKDALRAAIRSAPSPAGAESSAAARAHAGAVNALAFTPDGKTLVSAGLEDRKVKLWSVADAKMVKSFPIEAPGVWKMVVTPDGHTLIAGCMDRTVKLFSLPEGTQRGNLTGLDSSMINLGLTGDARTLATASGGAVTLWSLPAGRRLSSVEKVEALATALALAGDGRTLATAPMTQPIRIWSLPGGRRVTELKPPGTAPDFTQLTLSADGRMLAAAQGDGSLTVWSLPDGRLASSARGHAFPINGLAMSADGRTVLSASSDMTVKVWRLPDARITGTFRGHADEAFGVALSSDGAVASSSDKAGVVFLWDTATAAVRGRLSDPALLSR